MLVQSTLATLDEIVADEKERRKDFKGIVVNHFREIKGQILETEESLLSQIDSAEFASHKADREKLVSELAKFNQFALSAKGVKLMSEAEIVQCLVEPPKFEVIPKLNQTIFRLKDNKAVIKLIAESKISTHVQPKLYFGDGSQGDLIVDSQVTLPSNVSQYKNIIVKRGGTLSLVQYNTHIALVSCVFEVEDGGWVTGLSSTFYVAAEKIKVGGNIQTNGQQNSQSYSPGGKVMLACKNINFTGNITATGGTTYNNSGYNYSVGYGTYVQNPSGTISLQYETGEVTGSCNPDPTDIALRFDKETESLVAL
eukprot:Phypoly_transcript_04519.p1 GENE.Phypoly_transcript_04519~~Phypoly_transcript_04519.p1  ORF type:complete len:311 (+),score=48.62 Phypoly_transcript_04519:1152-2084(+)